MKTKFLLLSLLAGLTARLPAQQVSAALVERVVIQERGPHSQRVKHAGSLPTDAGVIQLECGLNFLNDAGEWEEARAEFELQPGHARAWKGRHKVTLAANPNTGAAVQMRLPEGQLLSSHVHGLAYYDTASGEAVLIAEVTDSTGVQIAPNQILYPATFTALEADLVYTYTKSGFEQDVILRQQPPSPEIYGLDPATTQLEVWTEFEDAPRPLKVTRPAPGTSVLPSSAELEELANLQAEDHLAFGETRIETSRSFMHGRQEQNLSLIIKHWLEPEPGRAFLVETVGLNELASGLEALPPASGGANAGTPAPTRLQALRALSRKPNDTKVQQAVIRNVTDGTDRLVAAHHARPGLVLDYQQVSGSLANQRFAGDETYYVSGPVTLTETTTFEGSVVKFATGLDAKLLIKGPANFETTPHRPLILTAANDNSVGQFVSSGTPSIGTWYASTALEFDAATSGATYNPAHVTVRHANKAFSFNAGTQHRVSHVQVVNCQTALALSAASAKFYNALVWYGSAANSGTGVIVGSGASTVDVQHLTADGTASFVNSGFPQDSATVANTLFVGVTPDMNWSIPAGSSAHVKSVTATPTPFVTVQGGKHYLLGTTGFRNAGVTTIDAQLKADLAGRTTHAPVVLTSAYALPMGPTAARDGDVPDLGYHYPPVDYVCSGLATPAAFTNGPVVAIYGGYGFNVADSSQPGLTLGGSPDQPARVLPFCLVQEEVNGTGGSSPTALFQCLGAATYGRRIDGQFAELIGLGRKHPVFVAPTYAVDGAKVDLRHSSLHNLNFTVSSVYQSVVAGASLSLFNTDVERSTIDLAKAVVTYNQANYNSATTWTMFNNLFWKSRLTLRYDDGASYGFANPACYVRDCLFDGSTNQLSGTGVANVFRGYNGLKGVVNVGTPTLTGTGDVSLSALQYDVGPFGRRYRQSSDLPLANVGSRIATLAGLYHFTTTLDQVKEGWDASPTVDIGLHYPSTAFRASEGFGSQQGPVWEYHRAALTEPIITTALNYVGPSGSHTPRWEESASPQTYCWILADWQAPSNGNDSVRVFRAPYTGTLNITGKVWAFQAGGDGQNALIRKIANGTATTLVTTFVPASLAEANALPMNCTVAVNQGDLIHFRVNRNANPTADGLRWNPVVAYLTSAPASDLDRDGLADYLEDSNGNGAYATGDLANWGDPDTDDDELSDSWELGLGLNPTVNEPANSTLRRDYAFDLLNRLEAVTGKDKITLTLDEEGNITQATP